MDYHPLHHADSSQQRFHTPYTKLPTSCHPQLFNDALGTTNVEWDPYKDDVHFVLSTFALEEIGATGDKGVTGLVAINGNGTVVDLVGGLAQSAGYQAAADRYILWTHRNDTLPEFGKTVNEVMEELTSYRQALTGDVQIDQGLTYRGGINVVPTDGNGVTLSRTPQQVGWVGYAVSIGYDEHSSFLNL